MIYEYALVDPENAIVLRPFNGKLHKMLNEKWEFGLQHEIEFENLDKFKNAIHPHLSWKTYLNKIVHAQLLQTCKQIHHEATPLLYSHNHFVFPNYKAMGIFLGQCGKNIQFMTRISLNHWPSERVVESHRSAFNKLTKAMNLQALFLEEQFLKLLRRNENKGPSSLAKIFHSVAHGWLWATAIRRGGVEHALDLLFFPPRFPGHFAGHVKYFIQPSDYRFHSRSHRWGAWSTNDEAEFRKALLGAME